MHCVSRGNDSTLSTPETCLASSECSVSSWYMNAQVKKEVEGVAFWREAWET